MKTPSLLSMLTVVPLVVTTGVLLVESMGAQTTAEVVLVKQIFFHDCLLKDDKLSCHTCRDISSFWKPLGLPMPP